MTDGGLLERIAAAVGCEYLSEISYVENVQQVHRAIREISPAAYTPQQWGYALSYITGQTLTFESTGEVNTFISNGWTKQEA